MADRQSEPIDFVDISDVDNFDDSFEMGQRRLTDLSGRDVMESSRGGWIGWLFAATVVAVGIVTITWLLVTRIWPLEDEVMRARTELSAAQRDRDELQRRLLDIQEVKSRLESASRVLADEVEKTEAERQELERAQQDLEAKMSREGAKKTKKKKRKRRRRR